MGWYYENNWKCSSNFSSKSLWCWCTKELRGRDTEEIGPFEYIQGTGAYVPTIEMALMVNKKGYKTSITLVSEQGYGEYDETDVEVLTREDFDEFEDIYEGMEFIVETEEGYDIEAKVIEIEDDNITVDYNHPFAGKFTFLKLKF